MMKFCIVCTPGKCGYFGLTGSIWQQQIIAEPLPASGAPLLSRFGNLSGGSDKT